VNLNLLQEVPAEWRAEADLFRRRGQDSYAKLVESLAADLEARIRVWASEPLSLSEAVRESGFSRSTLERRIEDGSIPNVGQSGAPRVRRIDLPQKGGRLALRTEDGAPDLATEILARRASR
jgi:hypothetical protein